MIEKVLGIIKKIIPKKIFGVFQPYYHFTLALLAVIFYRFPSRGIKVVAITGTKGKSSTVEIVNSILEEAGYKTAVLGTIRFKIGEKSERNLYKMTMPGRFRVQKFLREAVDAGCDWAIMEMTSEGARLHRHKFIDLDALIFTNISPEHIESHGSYEKYLEAKLKIAKALESSPKIDRLVIVNGGDREAEKFLDIEVENKKSFRVNEVSPYKLQEDGIEFTFKGEVFHSKLQGLFNLYNILAGISFAESLGTPLDVMKKAISKIDNIKGRVEKINGGQDFPTVVDYAHTADSLEKFYSIFKENTNICVLGNTGGGRDKWKRKEMAKVAEQNCFHIILTNEDPYDEDPEEIVSQMSEAIDDKKKAEVIMDRREAINKAIKIASGMKPSEKPAVLITGKGTDPYIMEAGGKKTPWSDEEVAREELRKIIN